MLLSDSLDGVVLEMLLSVEDSLRVACAVSVDAG